MSNSSVGCSSLSRIRVQVDVIQAVLQRTVVVWGFELHGLPDAVSALEKVRKNDMIMPLLLVVSCPKYLHTTTRRFVLVELNVAWKCQIALVAIHATLLPIVW